MDPAPALAQLTASLKRASCTADAAAALSSVQALLASEGAASAIWGAPYAALAATALGRTLADWAPLLPPGALDALFAPPVPRLAAVRALARALALAGAAENRAAAGAAGAAGSLPPLLALLPARAGRSELRAALGGEAAAAGRAASREVQCEAGARLLVTLPDVVANAVRGGAVPEALATRQYARALAGALWDSALGEQASAAGAGLCVAVLELLCRRGAADDVATIWWPALVGATEEGGAGQRRALAMLGALPDGPFEQLFCGLLRQLQPFGSERACFRAVALPRMSSSRAWRHAATQRLLTGPLLPGEPRTSFRYLVDASAAHGAETLRRTAAHLLTLWADPSFAVTAELDHAQRLAHGLLLCVALSDEAEPGWAPRIIQGVQTRLGSSLPEVRELAMHVGEGWSTLRGGSPLSFDEGTAARAKYRYWELAPAAAELAPPPSAPVGDSGDLASQPDTGDADELMAQPDDSQSDSEASDAGSEDSLVPYDAAESEGAPACLHVRQLSQWLRLPKEPTPQDYERQEAAIAVAPALLRAPANRAALEDNGVRLVQQLMHTADSNAVAEGASGEPSPRQLALCACVVGAPRATAHFVCSVRPSYSIPKPPPTICPTTQLYT